jgi:DnaJ-domain-containing protein 1
MIGSASMSESHTRGTSPIPGVHVERVLPQQADLSVGEVDAILEAAYLATAADGELSPEELEAFRSVASALRHVAAGLAPAKAKPISDRELDQLFERFAVRSDHVARAERITAVRARLGRTHVRELAYKVAFAMSLCDLDANEEEAAYDDELIEAFAIDGERADTLAAEVYAALDADLDRDSEAPPR